VARYTQICVAWRDNLLGSDSAPPLLDHHLFVVGPRCVRVLRRWYPCRPTTPAS